MKVYDSHEIKNIALLGNDGSGKTTLTEALLYESGAIKRRGRITAKNTVSDYFPVEQDYGYSVFSTVFHVEWNNKKLNIIDCPGSDDFVGAAITALNVTDTAVLLINGQFGPEVGTQNHFRYTEKLGKPVIFLVNQLDAEKCDYHAIVEELQSIYGNKVVPIQYPIQTGPDFNSLIDVILMKKLTWGPEGGEAILEDIPEEEKEKAETMHKALVEAAAENDEGLMEKFFETDHLTEDEMREGIRKGLVTRSIFPVFCVCASKNMGVGRLMEFLGNVVPFVDEMPAVHNTRGVEVKPTPEGPTSVYFFKTGVEPHIGEVQYFKVMSGCVKEGDDLTNADRGSKERMAQLFVCSGANREKVEKLEAGDIGCTVKLKDVRTGNTLNGKDCDNRFNFIKYPNSKYTRAIRAVNEADTEKMMAALNRMRQEDPTWVVEQSKELRQILIHGQGEFHLRTLKWRLENLDKIPVEFFEQRIPYRETITKAARAEYRHKKQSGGHGQFGRVVLEIEPLERGKYYEFENVIKGGAISKGYVPGIEKGLHEKMEEGYLAGYPLVDIKITLVDGKEHPVDSSEMAFKLAAKGAMEIALSKAGCVLLEPFMKLEVFVDDEYLGAILSDLSGKRGRVLGQEEKGHVVAVKAEVPMAELRNYAIELKSMTSGTGSFELEFDHYEILQGKLAEDVIAEAKREKEAANN